MAVTPEQAVTHAKTFRPPIDDLVIETVDSLILSRFEQNAPAVVKITQEAVVEALVHAGYKRDEIFARHQLDFEPIYRAAGWVVTWHRQPYYETESSYWTFGR